jgi:cell division protein FtsI (penicillin-binding protein 3)
LQGVYELGSTAKIFAAAQALELGLMNADTMIDANSPMRWGKFKIGEFEGHNYGPLLSVTDVIVKSSNVGTAHIALQIGGDRQQAFFKALGLFDPVPIELTEAPGSGPLIPKRWSDIVTITTSYGHGMSVSPMHLAVAYSALANDGVLLPPTLLKRDKIPEGTRIVSAKTAAIAASMLRQVVARGTASLGDVEGYEVGGKTGTADKVRRGGGYDKGKNINTFAAMFPVSDPQYVLVVTLDEASENTGPKPRRTAGWTTVPVAAEVIRRVAPLLGLRPQIEYTPLNAVSAPQQ